MTQDDLDLKVETEVINKLPYAITLHNNFDTIIYENETAKELFGIRVSPTHQGRRSIKPYFLL